MTKNILLLFDIDGTLLLSGGCGRIALEKAFEEIFGIPNCWGDTIPHGKTDPIIIDAICKKVLKRKLTLEENKLLCDRYHDFLRSALSRTNEYRLMPGVIALLDFLVRQGNIFLAIGTGNFETAGWLKLERGKIRHFFECGGFASDADERPDILRHAIRRAENIQKSAFPKEQIYVVGDTPHDVRAARVVGLKAIAVLTNHVKKEDFEDTLPDHLLRDFSDIPAFMACLKENSSLKN